MAKIEKTIRPADNAADKTIRPKTSVEKTMRAGGSGVEKTTRATDRTKQGETGVDKTTRAAITAEKTMRGDAGISLRTNKQEEINKIVHQVAQQTERTGFLLNNVNFEVVRPLSENTGEADVYLVKEGENLFALKLYHAGIEPDKDIIEIVRQNSGNPALTFLVDTFHHGFWTDPKTGHPHFYELMAYCRGGSLDQITITHNSDGERLLSEIAIKCAACLDFLHSKQVIHRDVKPANFFFMKEGNKVEDLSLADFGIAIRCSKNGEASVQIQMRTKIYAAPEYYVTIDGITITKGMDFYSLGMMLFVLWEGGEERYRAPGERVLWQLKQNNKLPYPHDMPPRLLQLAKALTIAAPERRAGYAEVVKWAKGEDIYNEEDIQLNIVYNATRKQIAKSREELVGFMLEDPHLATTYLYRGQIAAWLKEINFNELSNPLEEITDTQFPKNKEAGFWAACYFLDPNLKYVDINNRAMEENEEIAATLKENFNYYSQALADKHDKLFIYLNATGRGEVNNLIPLFKKEKENRDALLRLIYALDPSLPWIISTESDERVECHTIVDILQLIYRNLTDPDFTIGDQSEDDLCTESFLSWIGTRDKALEGKIRSTKGDDGNIWSVLYNLNPKVSYNFVLDEHAGNYFFTPAEIGEYMNLHLDDFIRDEDEDSYACGQLKMMLDIDDTALFHYFKSKGGAYDDKIDWIKYCADVNSKENENKAGPYNWDIAIYKAIKGLGYDPFYHFPKSDKYVFTLDELEQIPRREIKEELDKGYLESWLTIFFQEDPHRDLSPQFAYEEATRDYMTLLEKLDKNHKDVVNYRIATNHLRESVNGLNRKYRFNLFSKVIVSILTFIATAVVIYGLQHIDIPTDRDFHSTWIYVVAIIAGISATVYTIYDISNDLGCLGTLLIGAFFAALTYFALLFIAPYLVYIVSALLLTMLVLLVIRLVKSPVRKRANTILFNPSIEERVVEPLNFAFNAEDGAYFKSSIGDRIDNLTTDIGQNTKAFYRKLIFPWVSIILLGVIAFGSFTIPGITVADRSAKQRYTLLQGEWTGTFDQREATFNITNVSKEMAEASISVHYREMITESLKGSINWMEKTFHFDDVNSTNGYLDGEYNGAFNDDFTKFSGTYQNYTTKKQVDFMFVK